MIKTPANYKKWNDITDKHHKHFPAWSPTEIEKVLYNEKLNLTIVYYTKDYTKKHHREADISIGYPITTLYVRPVYEISRKNADDFVKEPFNTMVQLFGKDKTKSYLEKFHIKAQIESKLRPLIKKLVGEVLEEDKLKEMSVTGNIAGYETPYAFSGGNKERTRKNSEKLGYKLVRQPEEGDTEDLKVSKKYYRVPKLAESRGAYYDFKKDESLTPRQKIGNSVRIIRHTLSEVERLIDFNLKLKQEEGVESKDYWKRTHTALSKIEERLIRVMNKIKNFRD